MEIMASYDFFQIITEKRSIIVFIELTYMVDMWYLSTYLYGMNSQ